eukprot:6199150-Pleurochrysis_carterae.AAC.2
MKRQIVRPGCLTASALQGGPWQRLLRAAISRASTTYPSQPLAAQSYHRSRPAVISKSRRQKHMQLCRDTNPSICVVTPQR